MQLKLPDDSQEWLYLFLLIEFQSKADPWMALRMLTYVCLLYQDLIKAEQVKPGKKLPPVFPVVIYNGQATWRASLEIAKLIDAPDSLKRWTPRFRHHLLDQGRVPEAKLKQLSDNLMACLIVLETHLPDDPVILETTRTLVELLKDDDFDGLDRAFTRFYRRTILSKLNSGQMTQMPETLEGVTTVLAERIDEWMDGLRHEGRREGREEGKQSEAVRMLSRLLRLRFGPVPDWAEARLAQAPLERLEGWIEAVLTAESLEGVIGPEG